MENINKFIENEIIIINDINNLETLNIEKDLNYLFINKFGFKIENISEISLKDKYKDFKENIEKILPLIEEIDYNSFVYLIVIFSLS